MSTVDIAWQQFNIAGAEEKIQAVPKLSDVFSPPHHGPRNIPISVQLLENLDNQPEYSYVHFPIVRTGKYAIYLDTPGVFHGFIYGGTNQNTGTGTEIPITKTSKGSFQEGFVSQNDIIFNQNDPQPIAIRLKNTQPGKTIKYIVSLFT
ncbi:MAG: hypothetical protein F6J93_27150 [Oscillatoria sp. SIO1A7]|nr:hypothetical protein [Oscillatoria sp. SIO1A7]